MYTGKNRPSLYLFIFASTTLKFDTLCLQLRVQASTSVWMNMWSILWQSTNIHTPMMSCHLSVWLYIASLLNIIVINVQCIKGITFCCRVQVKFWSYSLFRTNILYLLILGLTLLCGQRLFAVTGKCPSSFTAIRWSNVTYHTCTRYLWPGACITQSKWGGSCLLCLNASHPRL